MTSAIKSVRAPSRGRGGFTLVEMLVVAAVIAILTALLAPAVQGLMGVSGRRGGMNTVSSAIEQARLKAVEDQATVYVGFPLSSTNPSARYSSLIVFKNNAGLQPLTRWIRLPTGVYYEPASNFPTAPLFTGLEKGDVPELDGETINELHALAFDRFGRMSEPRALVGIRVGEKPDPDKPGEFLRDASNFFELTVHALTGRVTLEDKSVKKQ